MGCIFRVGAKMFRKNTNIAFIFIGLLLGYFVAFGAGCSLLDPFPLGEMGPEQGIGPCETDDDCLQGQECKLRYCRASATSEKRGTLVSLKLIPPAHLKFKGSKRKAKITEQQFLGVDLNILHRGSGFIWPREAYKVSGELISWQADGGDKHQLKLAAKIRFIDHNSIKGQPLIREISTSDGQFQVWLSYGTYRVEVFPEDERYPPKYLKSISVKEERQLTIELPPLSRCQKLEGRLVSASESRRPLSQLELRILDIDGKVVSGKGKTDGDGRFQLWISPEEKPHFFHIDMRTEPPLHPEMDLLYRKLVTGKPVKGQTIELGHLPIGLDVKRVRLSGQVRSLLQEGNQSMPDMPMRLSGIVAGGHYGDMELQGKFRLNFLTDRNGHYEAFVPRGKYQIEVLPPYNSPWARVTLQPQMITTSKNIDIKLVKRYQVQGNICQAGELGNCKKRISQAQIQAIWRNFDGRGLGENAFYARPPSHYKTEQTGLDGAYRLRLDPGIYDLIFIPPNNSGLARAFSRVCIRSRLVQRNAFLPKAKYLVGKLFGPDRFPIAGMVIEMYEYNSKGPARLLGRAVSLSQGQFSLPYALPNPADNQTHCK